MNAKRILIFIFVLTVLQVSYSQDSRPYRNYSTQKVHQSLLAAHPEFTQNLQAIEAFIKNYGSAGEGREDTIPVVFHIVYGPGQTAPDEAQIKAQLDALNRDFEHYLPPVEPYTFDKVQELANKAVDPDIFFCLPNYDAAGNPASAIEYISTTVAEWPANDAIKSASTGGANPWEPGQYLNIWVGTLQDSKAGYAQLPGGPAATDGIVIDSRYFGTGTGEISTWYNSGKTLSHLVGSYLGLYELWNEITPCTDDNVADTPIHNEPNYGIGTNYHHLSLCDATLQIEMVMNLMDNTDDLALNMFTQGQKNRMKAILSAQGWRSHLPSGNVICGGDGFQAVEDRNNKQQSAPAFRLFPNPASNILNLEISGITDGSVRFSASNTLGETIWFSEYTTAKNAQLFRTDCSAWPAGEYIIHAAFENGKVISRKVYIDKP